jgi:hypothetical protein
LFTRGPLFFIKLAVAVLVKFLDQGFPDVLAGGSAASAFAGAATLCLR